MSKNVMFRRDSRLIVIQVLVMALVGTLFVRLAWIQLAQGASYRTAAVGNSIREVVTPAPRGLMLDQAGRPLVANRSSLTVTADRVALAKQPDDGKAVLTAVAGALGTTYDDITARMRPCGTPGALKQPLCWNGPVGAPVVIGQDVAQKVGLQLLERRRNLPGIATGLRPVRAYPRPYSATAAHVVGYLGPINAKELAAADPDSGLGRTDEVGRSGLEEQYDVALRGTPGLSRVAVSRSGQQNITLADTKAVAGKNLVTNIDARLQGITEQHLQAAVDRARGAGLAGDSGSVVVVDVTNGHVLAMASYPDYDPLVWVGGISEPDYGALTAPTANNPLLDRSLQGLYAPASTFKIVSTAAAVAASESLTAKYDCPSWYSVGDQKFRNYKSKAFGTIDLARALEVSCDTVFYKLAFDQWQRDGGLTPGGPSAEFGVKQAQDFGLDRATGIDLPGESRGRIVGRVGKLAAYTEQKDAYCARATSGYPEVKNLQRANLLMAYAKDYCTSGGQYRAGDALNFAVGQGDTVVTPLAMTMAYAALANGGTLWRPQIARALVARDGRVDQRFSPIVAGKLSASDSTLDYIRAALTKTSLTGTTASVFAGFPLAAVGGIATKTGTAEVAGKSPTSWLASFAPANKPRYGVLCVVSEGGTGSGTCGPSVRAIYEALFGVTGSTVNLDKSVFPGGVPADVIPTVTSDGIPPVLPAATVLSPSVPPVAPEPSVPPTPPPPSPPAVPAKPVRPPGEAPVGVVPSGAMSARSGSLIFRSR